MVVERRVLFLIGAPGTGKTTQGALLAGRIDARHVSVGDLVRAARAEGESIPGDAAMRGMSAPGWTVERIAAALGDVPLGVVDGFPRTPAYLPVLLTVGRPIGAIRLTISLEEAIDRMRGRAREGENVARIADRWNTHRKQEKALDEALRASRIRLVEVDGHGDTQAVLARVESVAGLLLAQDERRRTSA